MFKKLKAKVTRRLRRMSAHSDIEVNDNHRSASSIFRLALREPGVDLLLRPVQGKRIIKLEERGMFIILNKTTLEITNHAFSFMLEIPYDTFLKLSKLFDIRLDYLTEQEENKISSQVNTGLSKVLDTFKPINNAK